MRQLIIDRILNAVNDGVDLSNLEFFDPITVEEVPVLPDEELLSLYESIVGFQG